MNSKGWTIVELLVTIAIIGILSTIGFASTQSFSSEQKIDDGVNQVQALIRTAQANATSSLKCGASTSYNWSVVIRADRSNIDLNCKVSSSSTDTLVKTLTLPANITVSSITVDGGPGCTTSFPTTIAFAVLSGSITYSDPGLSANCAASTSNMVVTLRYAGSETILTKDITISKGGGIDAQQ